MCMFFSDVHVLRFSLQRSAGLHLPSRACTFMQHSISIPGHRGWATLAGHSGQPSFPSARCPRGTAWAHLPGTRALPLPTRASEGPAEVPRLLDVQSGPQAKRPCWPGGHYPLENTGKLCVRPHPPRGETGSPPHPNPWMAPRYPPGLPLPTPPPGSSTTSCWPWARCWGRKGAGVGGAFIHVKPTPAPGQVPPPAAREAGRPTFPWTLH